MAQVISKSEVGSLFSDEKRSGDVTAMFSIESANQVDLAVTEWQGKTFALKSGGDKMGGVWNVDWDQHTGIQCGGATLFPGSREEAVNAVAEAVNASEWWKDDENISQSSEKEFSASSRPRLDKEIPCQVTLLPGVSVKLSQFPGAETEVTDLISKDISLDVSLKLGNLIDRRSFLGQPITVSSATPSEEAEPDASSLTTCSFRPYKLMMDASGHRGFGIFPASIVHATLNVNGKDFARGDEEENPTQLGTVISATAN